jgi:transcriptional regulator with GAF, ATPase, and Fis domain
MNAIRTPFPAVTARSVVVVTHDVDLRLRLVERLQGLRWNVFPAAGGADATVLLDVASPEALIVDHWLSDLNVGEFMEFAAALCPGTDILSMDGSSNSNRPQSLRRNELLHALREVQNEMPSHAPSHDVGFVTSKSEEAIEFVSPELAPDVRMHLPEVVGDSAPMRELARMVRLVAEHKAIVLIQGETGTGKELVAKAVHRLSLRASKAFAVLNCAAIPEHLLEAELFGHTRGAFTGAVTSRIGRIEAAHGGTLFLDEIGEMPLPLQAKMLRFLESGEIQRVGDNDVSRVDVRIVAATHQRLEKNATERLFREDLYYRLAVFPINVPPLRDRREDIAMLVEHCLRRFGEDMPRCSLDQGVLESLMRYHWPGNVRQLNHCLQRACILTGVARRIGLEHLSLPQA